VYRYTYDGGDHVIFVGEVKRVERREGDRPLFYFGSGYRRLHPRIRELAGVHFLHAPGFGPPRQSVFRGRAEIAPAAW
jgi:hypothetical protein